MPRKPRNVKFSEENKQKRRKLNQKLSSSPFRSISLSRFCKRATFLRDSSLWFFFLGQIATCWQLSGGFWCVCTRDEASLKVFLVASRWIFNQANEFGLPWVLENVENMAWGQIFGSFKLSKVFEKKNSRNKKLHIRRHWSRHNLTLDDSLLIYFFSFSPFPGDEIFSDTYKIKLVSEVMYEVTGKLETRKIGEDIVLAGSNPSAEEADEGTEAAVESGCDIVLNHRLQETHFADKKQYLTYLKDYMKKWVKSPHLNVQSSIDKSTVVAVLGMSRWPCIGRLLSKDAARAKLFLIPCLLSFHGVFMTCLISQVSTFSRPREFRYQFHVSKVVSLLPLQDHR